MLSYSPVDNIERKAYPNMLVLAGLHDPRWGSIAFERLQHAIPTLSLRSSFCCWQQTAVFNLRVGPPSPPAELIGRLGCMIIVERTKCC